MSGFEHQVAAHMMAEGMIAESLVLTRVINDRYHGAKRNPFNEIECSDHYARAMASYGTFLNTCGYEYHGPKKYLAFSPKFLPERFKAAYTTAEGWGSYEQIQGVDGLKSQLSVAHGKLQLLTFAVGWSQNVSIKKGAIAVSLNDHPLRVAVIEEASGKIAVSFRKELNMKQGDILTIKWS